MIFVYILYSLCTFFLVREGIEYIILKKNTSIQHRHPYKEWVSRKLIKPRSKDVCSACLAFEDYRQFDISINDDKEQENPGELS